jgi:hypothetical protein
MQSQSLAAVVDALHISQIWDRSLPLDDEASRLALCAEANSEETVFVLDFNDDRRDTGYQDFRRN